MRKSLLFLAAVAIVTPAIAGSTAAPAQVGPPQWHTDRIASPEATSIAVTGSTVIERPGASFVKLHVNTATLQPGATLTVSNVDGSESYRYAGDLAASSTASVDRAGAWAMSISGDRAVVTVTGGTL